MTSSLRQDFNRFLCGAILGEEFVGMIKREIRQQTLKQNGLVNSRSLSQLSEKEGMRYAAENYQKAFRMAAKTSDPYSALKNLNAITPIYSFYLNFNAFLVTIQLLGDQEQASYWRKEIIEGRVIGGYGQTELGHGSNVKGLETQAVYDEKRQLWVLNSPTVTSAKFWPGVLGHFSTHQVVQARAIVKGKSLGIQTFVIEIRNEKLEDLTNVQGFDLGPKLGFEKVDNGGLILKHHEVPRTAMLMRYVKVSPDGEVSGLENASAIKYSYGSMLNLRVQLVFGFMLEGTVKTTWNLYWVFKDLGTHLRSDNRQFITDRLCFGFGGCLSNLKVKLLYQQLMSVIEANNYEKADGLLAKVHIISSTLKALSSRVNLDIAAEILTHNPLTKFRSTRLPNMFADYIPSATYEGDNTVLLQQTSKYLLFKADLSKEFPNLKRSFKSSNWSDSAAALEYIITKRLIAIKTRMQAYQAKDISHQSIMNEKEQVQFIRTAELWGYMTFLKLLNLVLPTIKQHQVFYRKIAEGFTNFIVRRIADFEVEGFEIERVDTWMAFSDEEYLALAEMNNLVEIESEPVRHISRQQGTWIHAKL